MKTYRRWVAEAGMAATGLAAGTWLGAVVIADVPSIRFVSVVVFGIALVVTLNEARRNRASEAE